MCASFVSLPALFVAGGYLFFFGLCGRAACTAQVGRPPLCGHPRLPFAPDVFVRRLPGPALSAARVVCARWVCLQRHSRFPSLFGVTVREKYSFLCSLPSKSLICLIFQDFAAPLWACLWGRFPAHGNSCFRAPSLPWGTSSCPEILHLFSFLCFPSLSYFIGGLGSSLA